MIKKTTSNKTNSAIAITGIAVASLALSYFLYGKNAPKHRRALTSWMLRAKADVMDKLEKAKDISEPMFHNIIDTSMEKYAKLKNINPADIALFGTEIKKQWRDIKKEITPKTIAKKSIQKTPKKIAHKK